MPVFYFLVETEAKKYLKSNPDGFYAKQISGLVCAEKTYDQVETLSEIDRQRVISACMIWNEMIDRIRSL